MEKPTEEAGASPTGVFQLSGEPAIVINGVPPADETLIPCEVTRETDKRSTPRFSEWLMGREVRKLFGEQFYGGKVTEFDKKTGWYRVVYEDGDFEDLEWHELEEVLVPLDITVPLTTLAMKMARMKQKPAQGSRSSRKTVSASGGKRGRPRKDAKAPEASPADVKESMEEDDVKCAPNAVVTE